MQVRGVHGAAGRVMLGAAMIESLRRDDHPGLSSRAQPVSSSDVVVIEHEAVPRLEVLRPHEPDGVFLRV